jgi:hypothetical protein
MSKKAKIVFTNDSYIIVDKTVAEAKEALDAGGFVEFPISELEYNYELNTINIGEKTVPAYDVIPSTKVINSADVQRVEEAQESVAQAFTGTGTLEDETETSEEGTTSDEQVDVD